MQRQDRNRQYQCPDRSAHPPPCYAACLSLPAAVPVQPVAIENRDRVVAVVESPDPDLAGPLRVDQAFLHGVTDEGAVIQAGVLPGIAMGAELGQAPRMTSLPSGVKSRGKATSPAAKALSEMLGPGPEQSRYCRQAHVKLVVDDEQGQKLGQAAKRYGAALHEPAQRPVS